MKKRAILNFSVSIAYQFINILIGLILPKFYTEIFGSVYNGLNQTVSQILSLLSVLQFGISAVSIQQMFKHIAAGDEESIAAIYWNTGRQYRRMGYVFLSVIVPVVAFSPLLIKDDLPLTIIFAFLLMRAFSAALEYFFQAKYGVILVAHNLSFVVYLFNIGLLLFGTALHATVLFATQNILLYQAVAVVTTLVRFLVVSTYIRRHFPYLQKYKKSRKNLVKNTKRTDVLVSEIAGMVVDSTDLLVLSSFGGGLVSASVYAVYHFVTSGLGSVLGSCREAVFAGIGKTYYTDFDEFKEKFDKFESVYFFLTFYLYTVAILLFKPFIQIYTQNMDTNYVFAGFPILFILAKLVVNLRIPAIVSVNTAGHFKQVKYYAVTEAIINITISLLLVKPLGIYGVLVGTIVAGLFRTPVLIWYTNKHILKRSGFSYLKKMAIWLPVLALGYVISVRFPMRFESLFAWLAIAVVIAVGVLVVSLLWLLLVDRKTVRELFSTAKHLIKR